jgi:transposase
MRYVNSLDIKEVQDLQMQLRDSHNHRERQRSQIILMSNQKMNVKSISLALQLSRDTIERCLNRYESKGFRFLKDLPRSGRPCILNESEKKTLVEYFGDFVQDIKVILNRVSHEMGKELSKGTLRAFLRKNKFSYKRIRKIPSLKRDDTAFQFFKEELGHLKVMEDNGEIALFFYDEMGIGLQPCISYGWQPIGKTKGVPSEKSPNITTMGFFNRQNSFIGNQHRGSINSDIVLECFDSFANDIMASENPKKHIVIVDNAPTHTSRAFLSKIKEWKSKNLFVQFIPAYCPELNYIEMLWKQIKYHWMGVDAYKNLETLSQYLDNILNQIGQKYRINFN